MFRLDKPRLRASWWDEHTYVSPSRHSILHRWPVIMNSRSSTQPPCFALRLQKSQNVTWIIFHKQKQISISNFRSAWPIRRWNHLDSYSTCWLLDGTVIFVAVYSKKMRSLNPSKYCPQKSLGKVAVAEQEVPCVTEKPKGPAQYICRKLEVWNIEFTIAWHG